MSLGKRAAAEFLGTFWLVLGGCGTAVLSAAFPGLGIGIGGVAMAFGLTVLTGVYAVGHISGAHFSPAVSLGLVIGKRLPLSDLPLYWAAQIAGAFSGACILLVIASGTTGFQLSAGFAANGYGRHSPGGYSLIRKQIADRIGAGFTLPDSISAPVVPNVPKTSPQVDQQVVAQVIEL